MNDQIELVAGYMPMAAGYRPMEEPQFLTGLQNPNCGACIACVVCLDCGPTPAAALVTAIGIGIQNYGG